jgi:p-cymene methyl-monooxygenase electron transfer component
MSFFKKLFGGAAPKNVTVATSGVTLEVLPDETVLERALKDGISYPHDCTVGTCGACRTKLVSGRVDAITPFSYTLSREELDAGYILACQAVPKTDLVVEVELGSGISEDVRTSATLVSTEPLTHDIVRCVWECKDPVSYKAGQYINVRWNGGELHRSYSFAAPPTQGGNTKIETFVRHVPGGRFTDTLFSGDAKNFTYELDGPHGNFWLRPGKGPILCVAGGSGLAPILSLLTDAASKRTRRDAILLFGGRASRDIYATDEISSVRNAWTAGFDYWPILSDEPSSDYRTGLVTQHIKAALERLGPDAQAYLCGPPAMIDAAIAELAACGVSIDAIFYDKFTDASTAIA